MMGDRVKIQAPRSGDHHMEICEIRVGKIMQGEYVNYVEHKHSILLNIK